MYINGKIKPGYNLNITLSIGGILSYEDEQKPAHLKLTNLQDDGDFEVL